jgi:hypothetical protein
MHGESPNQNCSADLNAGSKITNLTTSKILLNPAKHRQRGDRSRRGEIATKKTRSGDRPVQKKRGGARTTEVGARALERRRSGGLLRHGGGGSLLVHSRRRTPDRLGRGDGRRGSHPRCGRRGGHHRLLLLPRISVPPVVLGGHGV